MKWIFNFSPRRLKAMKISSSKWFVPRLPAFQGVGGKNYSEISINWICIRLCRGERTINNSFSYGREKGSHLANTWVTTEEKVLKYIFTFYVLFTNIFSRNSSANDRTNSRVLPPATPTKLIMEGKTDDLPHHHPPTSHASKFHLNHIHKFQATRIHKFFSTKCFYLTYN